MRKLLAAAIALFLFLATAVFADSSISPSTQTGSSHSSAVRADSSLRSSPAAANTEDDYADLPLLAPRLTTSQLLSHALIVHLEDDSGLESTMPPKREDFRQH